MKKIKKTLALLCCAVLLVCISVGATIAYLTSSDAVTNTFEVGRVDITLDEAVVNPDGTLVTDTTNRDDSNEYKLYPGRTYIKDPIVHVGPDSENCWIFVKLENGIFGIQGTPTIESQIEAKGWELIEDSDCVYAYERIVAKGEHIPVFDNFNIAGTVANDVLDDYGQAAVVVTAYAVQADGFATAQAAWNAAYAELGSPVITK